MAPAVPLSRITRLGAGCLSSVVKQSRNDDIHPRTGIQHPASRNLGIGRGLVRALCNRPFRSVEKQCAGCFSSAELHQLWRPARANQGAVVPANVHSDRVDGCHFPHSEHYWGPRICIPRRRLDCHDCCLNSPNTTEVSLSPRSGLSRCRFRFRHPVEPASCGRRRL